VGVKKSGDAGRDWKIVGKRVGCLETIQPRSQENEDGDCLARVRQIF
jgi:hypothetical protein